MKRRKDVSGFTLIELMITVAIVAILAAITYPSYREQVIKTRRADAKVALYNWAQTLERCYTQYGAYNSTSCTTAINSSNAFVQRPSENNYYQITGAVAAGTFILTATPTTGGLQAGDAKCTALTLNQAGVKGATGTAPTTCW